jgi:hypothetical protein
MREKKLGEPVLVESMDLQQLFLEASRHGFRSHRLGSWILNNPARESYKLRVLGLRK